MAWEEGRRHAPDPVHHQCDSHVLSGFVSSIVYLSVFLLSLRKPLRSHEDRDPDSCALYSPAWRSLNVR